MLDTYWTLDKQQIFLLHISYLIKCLKLAFIEYTCVAADEALHISLVGLHVALAFERRFFFLLRYR